MIALSPFSLLVWFSLLCAVVPTALFCWNLFLYRPPPSSPRDGEVLPRVSVLIPARNEELSIAAAVESVLSSTGVEIELIVLDDESTDRTAEIVREIARRDSRVRLERAPPLPAGWNGKQHACCVLAALARYEILCFLDADVRVGRAAIVRMVAFLRSSRSQFVSGFPRQLTATALEWLLLPLIHFVLLGFLPLARMRRSLSPALAAGCGQFLMVDRAAYEASGTHAAIRSTMHDGLRLPALFRAHGYRTDLADLTELAGCRMYRSAGEVWNGLAKNAVEGLGAPSRIVFFTLMLAFGQVAPGILLVMAVAGHRRTLMLTSAVALFASLVPGFLSAWRFRQRFAGAVLHPAGVALLLIVQWYALVQHVRGKRVSWKNRSYQAG